MTGLQIYFATIHPQFIQSYFQFGVFRSAINGKKVICNPIDLRDFAVDRHASIDDMPYGGGDGMVMRPEPLAAAVRSIPVKPVVLMTSPGAKPWTQAEAKHYALTDRPLFFVCGRFAGVDQRFIDGYVDAEYSLGDVVVSGGELPVLMMADSILRMIPGVLGDDASAHFDSFASGFDGRLEHPLFTRPKEFEGASVPDVLMSGDHKAIAQWRAHQSMVKTERLRPDLLLPKKK